MTGDSMTGGPSVTASPPTPPPAVAGRRRPIPPRLVRAGMDAAYAALLAGLFPWALGRACLDSKARARWLAYLRDVGRRFGRRAPRPPGGPAVWVHGVSVGEVKAAARLVESIEDQVPGVETIVTATTDTGFRVARERYPGRRVEFYPPDLSWIVEDALDRLRPDLVVLVESEFWPNFLTAVAQRDIPVALVNGRISERSAARFQRAGSWARSLMESLDLVCVQLPVYAERFVSLGVPSDRVVVTGNLKLDNVPILEDRLRSAKYANLVGLQDRGGADGTTPSRPLLVAGSTHPPEERMLGALVRRMRAEGVPLRLIVAPRHPGRADAAESDLKREGLEVARRSRLVAGAPLPGPDIVILLDTVGELEAFYALADVVFVGGSLVKHGGQNMMEPASLGKPVLVGPHTWNFRGEVDLLAAAGGIAVVDGPASLAPALLRWIKDPAAAQAVGAKGRAAILASKGATARTLQVLSPLLARLRSPSPASRVP